MRKPAKGKIHKNTISIVGTTNLKPGDEVVIVQPLRTPVLSSRTGKILGMDEKVLGRGTVMRVGNSLKVQLNSIECVGGDYDKKRKAMKLLHVAKETRSDDVIVKLVNARVK